jgi:hypothetical protein
MLLCGTKTMAGTCHHAFDGFLVGILYDPFQQKFVLEWFGESDCRTRCKSKEFEFPNGVKPYTRALSLHTLECIRQHGVLDMEDYTNRIHKSMISLASEQSKVHTTPLYTIQNTQHTQAGDSHSESDDSFCLNR